MKYEFIGTEGHGTLLPTSVKENAISISDPDGHIDWIKLTAWSEAEAIEYYFRAWKQAEETRIDWFPALQKDGPKRYSIVKDKSFNENAE